MTPPDLILLLADDLRADTLGCAGHPIVRTPHIDALARRGARFTESFVTTSICVVSRASILTGQWMARHGIVAFSDRFTAAAWDDTYPARLRAAGYRTGFVGKFGVGDDAYVRSRAAAFDVWNGRPGQGGANFIEPDGVHTTARLGEQARAFVASQPAGQPFCLSVSFNAPHARDGQPREFTPDPRDERLYADAPIPPPPLADDADFWRLPASVRTSEARRRWQARFADESLRQRTVRDYLRLVTGVDREVGLLVETLRARGRLDNAVIVFTSDNGFALGERGLADKWFAYEEDVRVPLIVAGPGVRPGVRDACALNVDLAPTLLDLAGVAAPQRMQGRSLRPLLTGRRTPRGWRREFFYEHATLPDLIPPCEAVRDRGGKYIRWGDGAEELYDLRADPWETQNLAADPSRARELARWRGRWRRLRAEAHP